MKNEIISKLGGILKNPGDIFTAYITPTGKQVTKLLTRNGKFSSVTYDNGTQVLIKSIKNVKK